MGHLDAGLNWVQPRSKAARLADFGSRVPVKWMLSVNGAETLTKGQTMKTAASRTLLLAAVTLLSACGGSTSNPPGAIANLFLKGSVTARATGTMEVNGVAVATPATVRIEGVERPESELRDGMQVKVKVRADATGHRGEGLEVEVGHAVKGKVEAKDATTLSVGGQTVRVDDSTHFEDNVARLGSIAAGERALYSTVQMPAGIPVATMAIGKAGAKNAGLFAVQILALADEELSRALQEYRVEMDNEVERKDRELQKR